MHTICTQRKARGGGQYYLDDFLIQDQPNSISPTDGPAGVRPVGNASIATHKTEGPSTKLTFLGIHIDTEAMQLSLDKVTSQYLCPSSLLV